MTKRMLIDATHAEETRVVVLDGNRLEDFDVETSTKKQLKGNIYLAKVIRVEPSLQAAFVEYGGNRHGFLAFGEIHPDYYQIPVADRQRLLEMQAEEARQEEEAEDRAAEVAAAREAEAADEQANVSDESLATGPETGLAPLDETGADRAEEPAPTSEHVSAVPEELSSESEPASAIAQASAITHDTVRAAWDDPQEGQPPDQPAAAQEIVTDAPAATDGPGSAETQHSTERPGPGDVGLAELPAEPVLHALADAEGPEPEPARPAEDIEPLSTETYEITDPGQEPANGDAPVASDQPAGLASSDHPASELSHEAAEEAELHAEPAAALPPPETVGGDADGADEARDRRVPPRFTRNYKIQEVIHRRQILLVQVVKEERSTKGAALTTYLSLAGRYCVLMPNSPRGGGISRKITSAPDRRRLKEIVTELDIPKGMGLIVRTAGANRPKPEIKRDCEYLLRLWDDIREHTLRSVAPALIYEEASLIKRAIRDVYSRDIDEVLVDGEEGWKAARDFMRMLMPSHAKKVQIWRDGGMPLFAKHQIEAQLDAILAPIVQLRSGGYLVINQTEALVAIDVNSGRSTRERNIGETALRTNLEAADEVARQLRLRDLAGLIVIDFIDMESRKHNSMVERRLKEALKIDRARIQVGHISHFGLLEMSRQRLRPSLAETSFITCPHCGGTGHIRSIESSAIHVLRHIEEEGAKRRAAEILIHVAAPVAMYLLNFKRDRLADIEARYAMKVVFEGDNSLIAPQLRVDRVRPQTAPEMPAAITPALSSQAQSFDAEPADLEGEEDEDEGEGEGEEESSEAVAGGTTEEGDRRRRRRRRRRRGPRREETPTETAESKEGEEPAVPATAQGMTEPELASGEAGEERPESGEEDLADEEGEGRGRRRGRRGGRRRRREDRDETLPAIAEPGAEQPDLPPMYRGPTPANPFGGQGFDIFEAIEQAEQRSEFSGPTPAEAEAGPALPVSVEVTGAASELGQRAPAAAMAEPAAPAESAKPVGEAEPGAPAEPEQSAEATFAEEPRPANLVTETGETADSERVAAAQPEPAPEPASVEEPAEEPTSGPVIQPILIGGEEAPPAEKRRGWWRR
jgi:ribonuclease E